MTFYASLRRKLDLPSKELDLLPRGYQILGRIMLIKLDKKLIKHKKPIGKALLELFPYIRTVCLLKGIKSVTRKPIIEIIAGCKSTQTLHKEHRCQFLIDVSQVMWSQGNKQERMRLVKMAKPKEVIIDMFAGIGYFSIFLAKYSKPKKIYAIDINPKSTEFLRKNTWLNNVENKIEVLQGDCRKFSNILKNIADRIIMGYLFETEKFLPYALKIAKNGCIVHMHRTAKMSEVKEIKKKLNKKAKVLRVKRIKSYAPKIYHFVFDLKVIKS
jgi:tRNA wybutosine-synthesizing protein 2